MNGWSYEPTDVSARVETLRRGDRIYLPGHHRRGAGRVVSSVEVYPAADAATVPPDGLPAHVIVCYFTGERARPLGQREPGEPGELVVASLRWLELGTRVRCRRARRTWSRCAYCGARLSAARERAGTPTCGGVCADAEKRRLELYGPPSADDAERELLELERELQRQADDA